jgi:hypothetical protein
MKFRPEWANAPDGLRHLASEREPVVFLFLTFLLLSTKKKK